MQRLLRFSVLAPSPTPSTIGVVRPMSFPEGFSTLITSAPNSAKNAVDEGPAITADRSKIFTPSKTSLLNRIASLF